MRPCPILSTFAGFRIRAANRRPAKILTRAWSLGGVRIIRPTHSGRSAFSYSEYKEDSYRVEVCLWRR